MNSITAHVRLCERQSDGRFWYEENNGSGWEKVKSTECACPENAEFALEQELKARIVMSTPIYHPERVVTVSSD